MTMVETDEPPVGSYVDDDIGGLRPGKWMSFDEERPAPTPAFEAREKGKGGWRDDFLDIRRASRQVRRESDIGTPALRSLPVPPPSSYPPLNRTAFPPTPNSTLPRLPTDREVELERRSSSCSGSDDLGEQTPLSPNGLPPPPPPRRSSSQPVVWRVGKIAPRRD